MSLFYNSKALLLWFRTGLDKGEAESYKAESTKFGELCVSSEAKGLMSLFHGQTECKKNHYGKPEKKANTLGVLGAGLMGAGIAQVRQTNKSLLV